jgi:rod shape-determining protein MreD
VKRPLGWAVLAGLVVLHFWLRPRLGDPRWTPDLLLVAFLLLATRSRPAVGAAAGFVVGLLTDAVAPTAFGAGALAHTLVGFAAGWATTLFVADSAIVVGLFVLAAAWLRDVVQVLASNHLRGEGLVWQLFALSPLAALSTAAAALLTFLVFRAWFGARRAA